MRFDADISDDELIEHARSALSGDTRAFEELVRRYEAKVYTNCRYLSGSPADAEDLAQEVFVKVYFGLAGFEGRASFETWVQRIKSNHCINFVTKRRLDTVDLEQDGVPEPEAKTRTDRGLEREETQARIGSVLLEMNETIRIPLVLRDMDGMTYDEIAEELGIGLSAVKMRIKRGREEFRRLYGESATTGEPAAAGTT